MRHYVGMVSVVSKPLSSAGVWCLENMEPAKNCDLLGTISGARGQQHHANNYLTRDCVVLGQRFMGKALLMRN